MRLRIKSNYRDPIGSMASMNALKLHSLKTLLYYILILMDFHFRSLGSPPEHSFSGSLVAQIGEVVDAPEIRGKL